MKVGERKRYFKIGFTVNDEAGTRDVFAIFRTRLYKSLGSLARA